MLMETKNMDMCIWLFLFVAENRGVATHYIKN